MIGQTISHYQIQEKLGEGGMGVVYKALDTKLNRYVALKFLPTNLTQDESSRKRFIVEAQVASALDHPNICIIHEINETPDGQLYICMACYEGESLRQKIKKGKIPLDETLNIFSLIAQGLQAAHEKNIIHRDIKPGNIFITDKGEVKILDFGLAKLAGMDFTRSTSSKGTAAYMSPEQIKGEKVDLRSDIWSLGIVLYELLTGHLPFIGEYSEPIMFSIVNEEPKPLSHFLKEVPETLQITMDSLLKKEPEERYASADEVLLSLEPLLKDSGIINVKPRFIRKRLLPRKKVYTYGASILLLIIVLLLIGRPYIFLDQSQENSMAVLPLKIINNDSAQVWLADHMTGAIITELAQISALTVISELSAMQYKGTSKAPPQISEELSVKYLIDGSITMIENQVRIQARLINASKDKYIWAKEYESKLSNILGLRGEIARTIADKIQVKLTPQEEMRLTQKREVNPETYELYMKGMFHLNKLTPDGIDKGLSLLNQAVDKDPEEPLVYASLAIAYNIIAHGASPIPDALTKAKDAAMKALELDENLAEVHLALAMIKTYDEMDWKGAEQANKRALKLNPNLALAHWNYGWWLRIPDQIEEGYKEMIRAKQLDPLNPVYTADLGYMYYNDKRFDESIQECLKSLELNPEFPQAHYILGSAYAAKGMYEEAIATHKKAGELSFDWKWGLAHTYALSGRTQESLKIVSELEKRATVWDSYCIAVVYAALSNSDKVFYWLEQAYKQRHPFIQWMSTNDLYFGAYKEDPRYKDLAQRLNLPER